MRAGWALLMFGMALPARAQTGDADSAIRYAENAFEYRDFDKVVEVLWPWLHPPRIQDPQLQVRARSLLGISLYLVGRTDDAREEFSALLLLEPDHRLDPFVVPPDIIQTFESIRTDMEPVLRGLRDKTPVQPESERGPPEVRYELLEVPDPALAFLPLGVCQFVLKEPAWGTVWLATQAGGLALNIGAYARGNDLPADDPEQNTWLAVQYAALGLIVVSYVASVIQANGFILKQRTELLESRTRAPPSPAPRTTVGFPGFSVRF